MRECVHDSAHACIISVRVLEFVHVHASMQALKCACMHVYCVHLNVINMRTYLCFFINAIR